MNENLRWLFYSRWKVLNDSQSFSNLKINYGACQIKLKYTKNLDTESNGAELHANQECKSFKDRNHKWWKENRFYEDHSVFKYKEPQSVKEWKKL